MVALVSQAPAAANWSSHPLTPPPWGIGFQVTPVTLWQVVNRVYCCNSSKQAISWLGRGLPVHHPSTAGWARRLQFLPWDCAPSSDWGQSILLLQLGSASKQGASAACGEWKEEVEGSFLCLSGQTGAAREVGPEPPAHWWAFFPRKTDLNPPVLEHQRQVPAEAANVQGVQFWVCEEPLCPGILWRSRELPISYI